MRQHPEARGVVEHLQCRDAEDFGFFRGVHELQILGDEIDIDEPTGGELEVPDIILALLQRAPVMVASSGTTVRIVDPLVFSTMVKEPISCCPEATSVTLICAACVGALALALMITLALPAASAKTVSVAASGWAGYWRGYLGALDLQQGAGCSASAIHAAVLHAMLGESGAALDALERARDARAPGLAFLGVDMRLATLRGQPRFDALLAQIGLT